MSEAELRDFKARLARGDKEALAQVARSRVYADRAVAGATFGKAGSRCRLVALVGLWTGEEKYLDWARRALMARATQGPGDMNKAHTDHYHWAMYASFLEAYDYLRGAGALSSEQVQYVEDNYFRKSMALTRDHWASKGCTNHPVVEDEAAVTTGACLQDEALLRWGLKRTFHHLAHDVLDDGMWFQDSMALHTMNVGRFKRIVKACLNSGIDLRSVRVPRIPHPPYPAGPRRLHSFGMMAEPMVLLATPDLKIPTTGYCGGSFPYARANLPSWSEMLGWAGETVSPQDLEARIRQQTSTRLPSSGFAALRSGSKNRRNYVLFHYGATQERYGATHPVDLNFVMWADGRFLTVDVPRIDGWGTPLYRSYVMQAWAHNVVVADQKPHGGKGGELVFFGQAPGLSLAHGRACKSYGGIVWERILALTDQYLVCVDRLRSAQRHTYDWMFHFACGPKAVRPSLKPVAEPAAISYPHFGNVQRYAQEEQIVFVGDCDGVRLSVRVLGAEGDTLALAACPAQIKQEPKTPLVERIAKIIIRRPGTNVSFVSVFEPIRGEPLVERIEMRPDEPVRIICRGGRVDALDLSGADAGYLWRSVVNGGETARAHLLVEKGSGT